MKGSSMFGNSNRIEELQKRIANAESKIRQTENELKYQVDNLQLLAKLNLDLILKRTTVAKCSVNEIMETLLDHLGLEVVPPETSGVKVRKRLITQGE
jgi:hypothetical protein